MSSISKKQILIWIACLLGFQVVQGQTTGRIAAGVTVSPALTQQYVISTYAGGGLSVLTPARGTDVSRTCRPCAVDLHRPPEQ